MKLKFDSSQEYQLQAVSSFVDLFDGQKLHKGDYSIEINPGVNTEQGSLFQSELGIGNNLIVAADTMLKNLHNIQERNDIDPIPENEFEKNGLNFGIGIQFVLD